MAKFFIHRPVFAIVISLVILIAGGISIGVLPIAQYPQITPPTVEVEINYPGANAETVEQSIATNVEAEVNGAENMIYMSSKSSSDGRYLLQCTFNVGTNLDLANVDINNRVNKAQPKLPKEAVAAGISVKKKSPDMLLVISLYSPDKSLDETFLSNYASINLVDAIARTSGVGSTMIVGQRDYAMRFWVRPDKLAKLGLTGSDIANVIQEQNLVAAAGQVGQPPAAAGTQFQYSVNVKGRLTNAEEFENMIVRTLPDGSILRMKDVSHAELSAKSYTSFGRKDGIPSTLIIVYQLPGANAIQTADSIRKLLEETAESFPPGLEYRVSLDSTEFVKVAIHEVFLALRDAIILVLIVVFVFLGSIRATFIPMLAVPVSLVGTFGAFMVLGFSINTLTMLGVVLAVGIVVDDAIVVVEAVEHHIQHGLAPLAATEKAMEEVSGPVVAIALVLCAVFVPVSFMGGIVGQLYKQFAITLSISVLLSALVALTLTPALCVMLLRPRKPMRGPIGMFLKGFNYVFERVTGGYLSCVGFLLRRVVIALIALIGLWYGAGAMLQKLPGGFVPDEDQGYFFIAFSLPDGASMERTDALMRRAEADLKEVHGIGEVLTMGGLNLLTNAYTSNNATIIAMLKPWEERHTEEEQIKNIMMDVRKRFAAYPEAVSIVFTPPPIPGLGSAGGFQYELQDKGGKTPRELDDVARKFLQTASQRPEVASLFTGFRTTIPQVKLDIDRDKARTLDIPINQVFQGLQIYLGGLQVNDFNLFGRTYKVMVQAEQDFRRTPDNIRDIYLRTGDGSMVPMSTLSTVEMVTGPDILQRFNMFRTAEISGANAAGYSSGDALKAMEEVSAAELPQGYGFQWSGVAFQEKLAGGSQGLIFGMALIFVFLVLAAQYESWAVPFSVLFGLPIGVFGAFLLVAWRGFINDVYVQIGIVTLMGLAAKNAILIVEFAKEKYERAGMGLAEAAMEGAKLRFRPIMMTAFAFILGVIPLVKAHGAGANARASIGTAVFGGMLMASIIGILFVPMLYVVVQRVSEKISGSSPKKE
ncbi:multidrug efflux RND transporter permease subunit [bacterium]|nr:multidrug efflux RND transporter permease subunit [bacterium]NUP91293.1 multidrug efflux RND transporter permease subunit [Candidatus Omnitrophota bacterium]